MTVINTNISALRASNASTSASMMQSEAMERLSTGKRINGAKDDAAGLAIATGMTSEIRAETVEEAKKRTANLNRKYSEESVYAREWRRRHEREG